MTEKILTQLLVIVVLFGGTWFLLSRIDFIKEGDMAMFSAENERKFAEFILKSIDATNERIENEKINKMLDSIKVRLCEGKKLDCAKIKLHLVRNSEVNAFALPDDNMVIFTGLLEYAENAEEVAGVMAHEIGHMEHNHVMKKLVKEIGLEMLFLIAAGDAGQGIGHQTAKVLSSTAFDRSKEEEADAFAVETLAGADIDPEHLGNMFFRLATKTDIPEELVWISTHPNLKDRAAEVLKLGKTYSFKPRPVLHTPWKEVQGMLSPGRDDEPADAAEAPADTTVAE